MAPPSPLVFETLQFTLPHGWTSKVLTNPARAIAFRERDYVEVLDWINYLPMWVLLRQVESAPNATVCDVANFIKSRRAYADDTVTQRVLAGRDCAFFESSDGVSSVATWIATVGARVWELSAVVMITETGAFPITPIGLGEHVLGHLTTDV